MANVWKRQGPILIAMEMQPKPAHASLRHQCGWPDLIIGAGEQHHRPMNLFNRDGDLVFQS